jgi:hypothetical protein
MPKLKLLSGREVLAILAGFGFLPESRGTLLAISRQALRFIPEPELRGHFCA